MHDAVLVDFSFQFSPFGESIIINSVFDVIDKCLHCITACTIMFQPLLLCMPSYIKHHPAELLNTDEESLYA